MAADRDEIYDEQAQGGDRELAWLAFRYIEGELALAEAAEFEVRLESDQTAREAVAAAVELAAAVEIASLGERLPAIESGSRRRAASAQTARQRGTAPSRAPRWKLSAGGMALATAACLAAVLLAYSFAGRNEPAGSTLDQHDSTALDRQLADAWAATAWRDGSLADPGALPEEFAVEIPDEDGPLVASGPGGSAVSAWESADGELMISDWLWEAVSGTQEAYPSESDHRANQGEG